MPELATLHQKVIDNPHEEAPRIVYADALSKSGDKRGEFIRLQCELAKMSPFNDRWSETVARERRLLFRHGGQWCDSLSQVMRRGFVTELISYRPYKIDQWGPEVFAQHPIDLIWFFEQEETGWGKIFWECEFLQQLRTIWIGGRSANIEASDLFDMLASPHLAPLQNLCVTEDCLEGTDENFFLDMLNHNGRHLPALQNLRALSIDQWGDNKIITDKSLKALIASELGDTLTCLHLPQNDSLTSEGIGVLLQSKLWRQMEELDFDSLDDVPVEIAQAWSRSKLQRLNVGVGSEQFEKLFLQSTRWGALTHLALGKTEIVLDDFRRFVEHPSFANLQKLQLGGRRFTDDHFAALVQSPNAAGLRSLNIAQHYEGDDGLIALSRSTTCNQLCELTINDITPEGIQAFVDSENFHRLHTFSFSSSDPGPIFAALAEATNLPALTNLSGYANHRATGEETVPRLLVSPHLKRLSYFSILTTENAECVAALRDAEHVVWLGPYCTTPELRPKNRLFHFMLDPTPKFFSWALPY